MHLIRRCLAFLATIAILFFTACGTLNSTGPKPSAPSHSDNFALRKAAGWDDYKKKCQQLNEEFAPANVVYNPTEHMRRGNSQTIEAAITLRTELPPPQVLETTGAIARRLQVSCVIEAELLAAEAEFDIQPQGWQSESLLTSSTARWTWFVTPKRGGAHELVLAFRPVISVEDKPANSYPLPPAQASTQPYRIMVDVSVPPDQWIADKLDRATALFESAKAMVVTLTALVVAIVALLAIKRRRKRPSPNNATLD